MRVPNKHPPAGQAKRPTHVGSLLRIILPSLVLTGVSAADVSKRSPPAPENVLFEATQKQIELIKPTGMPVTWALQDDALINPRYQKLLKEQAGSDDEIAARKSETPASQSAL